MTTTPADRALERNKSGEVSETTAANTDPVFVEKVAAALEELAEAIIGEEDTTPAEVKQKAPAPEPEKVAFLLQNLKATKTEKAREKVASAAAAYVLERLSVAGDAEPAAEEVSVEDEAAESTEATPEKTAGAYSFTMDTILEQALGEISETDDSGDTEEAAKTASVRKDASDEPTQGTDEEQTPWSRLRAQVLKRSEEDT